MVAILTLDKQVLFREVDVVFLEEVFEFEGIFYWYLDGGRSEVFSFQSFDHSGAVSST